MNAQRLIAENIRKYRKDAGLTQVKAARITGLTTTFWNHVEMKRVTPSVATLERMCKTIGVPMSKIFE